MANFNVTTQESILPRSGTVSFAISTSLSYAYITPYLYAYDANHNQTGPISPESVNGNWTNQDSFYIAPGTSKTISVDMSRFVAASNDPAFLEIRVFCNSSSSGLVEEEYFSFQVEAGYGQCKGPEWCVLDEYYTAGEGVKITWGAGTSGQNNPIVKYNVWCKEYDANDNVVGDWFIAASTSANTLEATVYPPDTPGNYHDYWVHAVGRNQSDSEDGYEGCYVDWGLTRVTACTEPSYCRLSVTESTGEAVTLSWGAGQSGVGNALVGYEVWVAPYDPDGDYPAEELWDYVGETRTNVRTMQVYPPDTPGAYYLFSVLSVGENYNSGDEWCDSENLLRRTSGAYSWTDPVLTARESYIRAVYITEMQDRTNALRTARGKAAYPFTKVTAGVTKIAKWAALIQEIRTAIDGMAVNHEAWAAISEGKPRIEHVMQIRRILDGM